MNKLTVFVAAFFLLILTACERVVGEGDLRTETRVTSSFAGLNTRISGNVVYVQGSEYKVELTAQQNILNVIETPIIDNKLEIRFKKDVNVRTHENITVRVTAPTLTGIDLSGSGNVSVMSPLTGNSLQFNLSGSGNMSLPLVTTSDLEVSVTGSGNLSFAGGTTTTATYKVRGSGNLDALPVVTKTANTTTSGSGLIKLHATETLNATISGSGSVLYAGNPVVHSNVSGSGRVVRM
ncbi:MAG TPA: head GIN domain-containing protein [Chitinophagaceae bacterium]|jgi:hypothetical protein|nr:head GIN domain-containing protein [Chitinophagaceae bacterium]